MVWTVASWIFIIVGAICLAGGALAGILSILDWLDARRKMWNTVIDRTDKNTNDIASLKKALQAHYESDAELLDWAEKK